MTQLIEAEPYNVSGFAESAAMDKWLDILEVDLTAIRQRRMTADQLERFTRLIHGAEAETVARGQRRVA